MQRIVSRCKCEFFYAGYGESSLDPGALDEVPPPPPEEAVSPWERQETAVDAFTLMHYDLDVCTNSLQVQIIIYLLTSSEYKYVCMKYAFIEINQLSVHSKVKLSVHSK